MKLLILSLVLLLLNSCSKSDVNEKMSTLMTKNLNKYKSRLLNKKINSLNNVVPDSLIKNNEANIIYLYTGNDCSLCVDNGFKFILEIDSLFKKQKIQVVSSNARVNLDQMRNQYYHYIHKDENDLIRRDLKFVYTPILIMLDSVSSIKDLFFPYTFRQDEKEKNFIASINKYENKITGVTK